MIAPGTVVQWHDHSTATRRLGTVASVRQSRKGPVYRVHEGNGSTGEPATYCASRNARGVLDFPGDVLTPYRRQWWPNPTPGGPALDHDPGQPEPEVLDIGAGCVECGRDTSPGSGLFVNRIPADHDDGEGRRVVGYLCPECATCDDCGAHWDDCDCTDDPEPAPALPPLVFVNVRDLDSGDGSPLALF